MKAVLTQGIVLGIQDYKDNDRLATLFCIELGKVTAIFKGVKKAQAKLKIAAMPFCYGNFELTQSESGMYIVTGCEIIESFYDLSGDYDRYLTATELLKICARELKFSASSPVVFTVLLKSLTALLRACNNEAVKIKFLIELFCAGGYSLDFSDSCKVCGSRSFAARKLDLQQGGVVCLSCASRNSHAISSYDHSVFRLVGGTPFERLTQLKLDRGAIASAKLLDNILQNI